MTKQCAFFPKKSPTPLFVVYLSFTDVSRKFSDLLRLAPTFTAVIFFCHNLVGSFIVLTTSILMCSSLSTDINNSLFPNL